MMHFTFNETKWQIIYSKLIEISKSTRINVKNESKIRIFFEACLFILKTGIQWCYLPEKYGKYKSIHKRFQAWNEKSIFIKLQNIIAEIPNINNNMIQNSNIEPIYSIDSTTIRVNQCAARYKKNSQKKEALGRSCGGLTTKIHLVVSLNSKKINITLTPGQISDISQAPQLIDNLKNAYIIGDKGYDSKEFVKQIEKQSSKAIIPSRYTNKIQRKIDSSLYKSRNVIERVFGLIKNFRRIATRYDKQAINYLGFVILGFIKLC